jgi:uncharacterized membrane protein YhaH (DUF805 family)
MRGTIAAIAPDGSYGQIAAEDGQRYSYWTSEIRNGHAQPGQTVDFQLWEGQPVDIFIQTVAAPPKSAPKSPPPQRAAAPQPQPQATPYAAAPGPDRFGAAAPSAYAAAVNALPPANYWITLFTSPSGRISRRTFWLHGVLPIMVCSLVLGWIPLLGLLVSLALTWASICISFKRFHDLGYPGWWSLASMVTAMLAALVSVGAFYVNGLGVLTGVLWTVTVLIAIAQLVFVYIHVGQEGPNRYGPDPLAA